MIIFFIILLLCIILLFRTYKVGEFRTKLINVLAKCVNQEVDEIFDNTEYSEDEIVKLVIDLWNIYDVETKSFEYMLFHFWIPLKPSIWYPEKLEQLMKKHNIQ